VTKHRPSNSQLCINYRDALTRGFYVVDPIDGKSHRDGDQHQAGLDATKEWRNTLWKQFKEIEERLCPLGVDKMG